jgi:hypothetical protein
MWPLPRARERRLSEFPVCDGEKDFYMEWGVIDQAMDVISQQSPDEVYKYK